VAVVPIEKLPPFNIKSILVIADVDLHKFVTLATPVVPELKAVENEFDTVL